MAEWRVCRLRDIVTLRGGHGFPEDEQGIKSGPLPFYKVSDMNSSGNERYLSNANNYVEHKATRYNGWCILPRGAVVFAKVGAALLLNRRRILTVPSIIDNNMMAAVASRAISPAWLYQWLLTIDFAELVQVGALPSINQDLVGKIVVGVPPLEEQRRIAETLDTIDETIQATARVIAKVRATANGLITDAVASALWAGEFRSLGEIADGSPGSLIQTGPFGSQLHASEYVNEGISAFMPTDIKDGELDFEGAAKISVKKADELGRHRLRAGDVLFARRGDLLRCAVVAADQREGLCGTGCLLVRIPEAELAPDWLVTVYRHDAVQRQVSARAVGSTMLNLSAGLIRSLLIPFPTQDSQRLMTAVQESSQRIEAERTDLVKLGALRAGLASDLLSGRVRTVAA